MKIIKQLLPVWLILLYIGGIAYMINTRKETAGEYQAYVTKARRLVDNDVITDAMMAYESALEDVPNPDLALEAGDVYYEREQYKSAERWYRNVLHASFPDDPRTYEYGIKVSVKRGSYRTAFQIYDEYLNRKLSSAAVEKMMEEVRYTYDLFGKFDDVRPYNNNSGLAAVKINGKWGYIDRSGDRILSYIYRYAGLFADLAAVVDQDGEAYFIDKNGNKKITEKSIREFDPDLGKVEKFIGISSGLIWAFDGEKWYCYDGETCQKKFGDYFGVTRISNGVGAVQNKDGKWALISPAGELLTGYVYDDVVQDQKEVFCRTDSVLVRVGDTYQLINKAGERVTDTDYEKAYAFYDSTFAAVKTDDGWVFIDAAGQIQDLGTYEMAKSFSNGMAAVRKDGKWGYIDSTGTLVLDYQFDNAGQFGPSGIAFVKPEGADYWSLLRLYKDNH